MLNNTQRTVWRFIVLLNTVTLSTAHWRSGNPMLWLSCEWCYKCQSLNLIVAAANIQRPSLEAAGATAEAGLDSQYLPVGDQHDYFDEARRRLAVIESSSTCKRVATVKILTTCENLQIGVHETDLENVQNLYAAHLAVCELEGAATKLPESCRLRLPPDSDGLSTVLDNDGRSQLKTCISALHSKSQWWTSYSNNRRDAYLWCKVMRPGFDQG